ncbi:TPA: DUF1642 domain-containing protein [Streptococcus pneumoniae]|nr:DUF1642 domain-containing protein [Streptococcus pneumoniae]HEX1345020.1 DUF1642 domain-containing protein [Streptococcus pneumoniae]
MNKEKVFIEGYEVGFQIDTLGTREKIIQLVSGETVSIDENFIYKSIEQEKVTIPQFVAEKIDYFKKTGDWDLFQAMDYLFGKKEIREWLEDKNNQETFARAWIDGYEVEKEKRYRIKLKSNSEEIDYLVNTERNGLRFYSTIYTQRREHTRKELEEAGFGWVFDCPGIKIEEVE